MNQKDYIGKVMFPLVLETPDNQIVGFPKGQMVQVTTNDLFPNEVTQEATDDMIDITTGIRQGQTRFAFEIHKPGLPAEKPASKKFVVNLEVKSNSQVIIDFVNPNRFNPEEIADLMFLVAKTTLTGNFDQSPLK